MSTLSSEGYNDGGWFDADGNWCYADNTYYDPQGVYHNADGSVYVAAEGQAPPLSRQVSEEGDWGGMEELDQTELLKEQAVGDAQISPNIRQWLLDDLWELKRLGCYWAEEPDLNYFSGSSRWIRLRLGFPYDYLHIEAEQARAWSIDPTKKVVIELNFPLCYWRTTDMWASAVRLAIGQPQSTESWAQLNELKLSFTMLQAIKTEFFDSLLARERDGEDIHDRGYVLTEIIDMMECTTESFTVCLAAYKECKNNVQAAMTLLTDDAAKSRLNEQGRKRRAEQKSSKKGFLANLFNSSNAGVPSEVKTLMRSVNVTEPIARLAHDLYGSEAQAHLRQEGAIQQLTEILTDSKRDDNTGDEQRLEQAVLKAEFQKKNHLIGMVEFLAGKLRVCNKFCITCSAPVSNPSLKPSICGSDLCQARYEGMGLGFSLAAEVRENPMILDLLISAAWAACQKNRMSFAAPADVSATVVDEKKRELREQQSHQSVRSGRPVTPINDTKEVHFLKGAVKHGRRLPAPVVEHNIENCPEVTNINYPEMKRVLNLCPSVAEMAAITAKGDDLVEALKQIDVLLYPLLRWIIISNKAHIRRLEPHEQIHEMKNSIQFVLLSSTPEREVKFQQFRDMAARKPAVLGANGSIWAWHGSQFENWHNILRIGLKNMSNTKHMVNAAAHGAGIYFAKDAATSYGYCRGTGAGWSKSTLGNRTFMALCEIADDPRLKKPTPYYVIQQEELVVTRFLFLCASSPGSIDAMSLSTKLPNLTSAKSD